MMESADQTRQARPVRADADHRPDARSRHALAAGHLGRRSSPRFCKTVRPDERVPRGAAIAARGWAAFAGAVACMARQAPSSEDGGAHVRSGLRVQIVRSYPHDRGAFTQGLVLDGGKLFESTGLVGQSSLREVGARNRPRDPQGRRAAADLCRGAGARRRQADSAHVAERQGARLRQAHVCASRRVHLSRRRAGDSAPPATSS